MKKVIVLSAMLLLGGGLFSQSNGGGNGNGNGGGNGNYGVNGAAGQEIAQSIVSKIAQQAAPYFGVPVGYIIQQYHIAECQIICIDPATKAYRVTLGGVDFIILIDGV